MLGATPTPAVDLPDNDIGGAGHAATNLAVPELGDGPFEPPMGRRSHAAGTTAPITRRRVRGAAMMRSQVEPDSASPDEPQDIVGEAVSMAPIPRCTATCATAP